MSGEGKGNKVSSKWEEKGKTQLPFVLAESNLRLSVFRNHNKYIRLGHLYTYFYVFNIFNYSMSLNFLITVSRVLMQR